MALSLFSLECKLHPFLVRARYKLIKWLCSKGGHMQGNVLIMDRLSPDCVSENFIALYAMFQLLEDAVKNQWNLRTAYEAGGSTLEAYGVDENYQEHFDGEIEFLKRQVEAENKLIDLYKWWLDYLIREKNIEESWNSYYDMVYDDDYKSTGYDDDWKIFKAIEERETALYEEATSKLVELSSLRDYLLI